MFKVLFKFVVNFHVKYIVTIANRISVVRDVNQMLSFLNEIGKR